MQQKPRIDWLDIAKGMSIILVVIYHTLLYHDFHNIAPDLYARLSSIMTPIRMPLFFTVSGFLAASAMRAPWGDFLRRKIWLLVYLFAIWSTARWLFFRYIQTNVLVPTEGSDPYQLLEMWWAPNTGIWFIWALAIFMIATKLLSSVHRPTAMALAASLSILTFGEHLPIDLFTHRNVLQYFVFFLFGCWYGKSVVDAITERPLLTACAGLLIFTALYGLRWRLQAIEKGSWALASSIAGLAWLCGTAALMSRLQPVRHAFSYFGRNTLPVYVTHVMIVSLVVAMVATIVGSSAASGYITAPLVVVFAIGLSLAIRAIADRSGAAWLYTPPTRRQRQAVPA
ncbi:putative membrane protein YcfT [Rhizobium sp. BK181]|uniref:acyltransferase family protein n=1 Tax=Rhizobium sp. BK181 TaxID=2587072 RepID=UPI00160D181C|nr:acyltransferase family protein [Rhizobium sp. BK181]MBB3315736.1 putative membrane protein YcfT [Rhizobium sp. BK181]